MTLRLFFWGPCLLASSGACEWALLLSLSLLALVLALALSPSPDTVCASTGLESLSDFVSWSSLTLAPFFFFLSIAEIPDPFLAVLPAVPPGFLRVSPSLAPRFFFFSLLSCCLISSSQFQLLGYSMRPRPIGSVRYAVGVEIVAHLSREFGSLQVSSGMIRPQASRSSRPRPQRRRSPFGTRARRGKIAGRGRCAGSGARDGVVCVLCRQDRLEGRDCAPRLCDTNCALGMLW